MKVYFSKIKDSDPNGIILVEGVLHFCATKPVVVQPSEIMKVPINSAIRVAGKVVLNIGTHPDLAEKVGEVFPGTVTLNELSIVKPLELAVRNAGRNPINIMPEDSVGIGYLVPIEHIEPEEFSIETVQREKMKSTPPKKNRDIRFEVKN